MVYFLPNKLKLVCRHHVNVYGAGLFHSRITRKLCTAVGVDGGVVGAVTNCRELE